MSPARHPAPGTQPHGEYRVPAGRGAPARWGGPLPPAPALRQACPALLLAELAAQLRLCGLDHLYGAATPAEGVLSVAWGVTVWTDGHKLRCHTPGGTIHLPASASAAARCLAGLARQQDGAPGLAAGGYPTSHEYPPAAHSHYPATMTHPGTSLPGNSSAAQSRAWLPGPGPRAVSLAPV
jgi:hypothetical protein